MSIPFQELLEFDVATLSGKLRARDISPVELTEAYLSRIERTDRSLRAYITVTDTLARKAAKKAEAELAAGKWRGPFHGVPIALKDLVYTKGLRTTGGSKILADFKPDHDATVWTRLKRAGAVLLGKLNLHEFAYGITSSNPHWGIVRNPYALDRIPGGSSGGAAAAIVARSAAATIGTDTGGSIRIPAAFCGCVGLKPTWSRVSRYGVLPLAYTLDHVGPMARTIADVKVLFEVMQGPDYRDTCAAPVPLRWPPKDAVRNLKIGYFEDDGRTPVTPETRAAVRTAAEALRNAGFQVERFQPHNLEEARELWHKYFVVAGGMLLRTMFKGRQCDLSPLLKQFLEYSGAEPALTAETLLEAWLRRDTLPAKFFSQMQRYPILLCPAAAIPAFRHGERNWLIEGKTVNYLDAWSYTEFFNLLGNPAVVVSVSHSPEGLPIGVQIVGRPWEEEQVLSVAGALEEQRGAWKIPPIA